MRPVAIRFIVQATAEEFGLTYADLTGSRLGRHLTTPRQLAMLLARDARPDVSPRQIGDVLGGRDRTTIIHGINTAGALLSRRPDLRAARERIVTRIKGEADAAALDGRILRAATVLDRLIARRASLKHAALSASIQSVVQEVVAW